MLFGLKEMCQIATIEMSVQTKRNITATLWERERETKQKAIVNLRLKSDLNCFLGFYIVVVIIFFEKTFK